MSTKQLDLNEIQESFNDLIVELEKVKDLNEISLAYKEHVVKLSEELKKYYQYSEKHQLLIKQDVDDMLTKFQNINNTFSNYLTVIDNANEKVSKSVATLENTINEKYTTISKSLLFLKISNIGLILILIASLSYIIIK